MTITRQATLRSAETLRGYKIHASDGEIGKVDQFLFDDESWTIRYLVVNTGNWLLERLVVTTQA
ncbi:PRC-barrel domain-containing protein [Romeria aff. gracilis LEGE 07310]|uniref:PRC-barrel domain-containing protein n=1 Tax=Vasconcelosia minhoensis LEGE 07310 TaxID=915328 RepID=A0A8J7DE11_9CYAN|nr:PRC-barrel domain-containing protein [Romeria aff. gracilis LEGE 07310]